MARKVFQYPAPLNLCHTDFLSLSLSLFLYLSLLLPPTHMHTHTNTLARTSHLLTLSSEILRQFFKPCALIYDPSKIKLLFYGTPELFFSLRTKKNWQTRKKRKHLKSKWRPRSDVRTLRRNSTRVQQCNSATVRLIFCAQIWDTRLHLVREMILLLLVWASNNHLINPIVNFFGVIYSTL